MRELGKALSMDLIRWIWLFLNSLGIRQPGTEHREIRMDIPLAKTSLAPAYSRSGGRSSRGPTIPNRRSDL
jgi:hypothetical protein